MNGLTQVRLALAIVATLAAFVVWTLLWRRKTRTRRARVAPVFGRVLQSTKSVEAGREWLERQRRVPISMTPSWHQEAGQFAQAWHTVHSQFPDHSRIAVNEANRLVEDVMGAAVASPRRTGRELIVRHGGGEAIAEDLRQAVVHVRARSDELAASHHGGGQRPS